MASGIEEVDDLSARIDRLKVHLDEVYQNFFTLVLEKFQKTENDPIHHHIEGAELDEYIRSLGIDYTSKAQSRFYENKAKLAKKTRRRSLGPRDRG